MRRKRASLSRSARSAARCSVTSWTRMMSPRAPVPECRPTGIYSVCTASCRASDARSRRRTTCARRPAPPRSAARARANFFSPSTSRIVRPRISRARPLEPVGQRLVDEAVAAASSMKAIITGSTSASASSPGPVNISGAARSAPAGRRPPRAFPLSLSAIRPLPPCAHNSSKIAKSLIILVRPDRARSNCRCQCITTLHERWPCSQAGIRTVWNWRVTPATRGYVAPETRAAEASRPIRGSS